MSDLNNIVVMDQVANATAVSANTAVQTPLEHVRAVVNAKAAAKPTSSVLLTEHAVTGLLVLRANDTRQALSQALLQETGVSLPETLQSDEKGDYCARWMTPDEWLLSCPNESAFNLENSLRSTVKGPIAVVNVSGGYSLLTLSGINALNVLKKSTVYDVSPENFPEGKVVNTTFAKSQITMRALSGGAFELVVRRSFADYVWLWLQRAGREYDMHCQLLDS